MKIMGCKQHINKIITHSSNTPKKGTYMKKTRSWQSWLMSHEINKQGTFPARLLSQLLPSDPPCGRSTQSLPPRSGAPAPRCRTPEFCSDFDRGCTWLIPPWVSIQLATSEDPCISLHLLNQAIVHHQVATLSAGKSLMAPGTHILKIYNPTVVLWWGKPR